MVLMASSISAARSGEPSARAVALDLALFWPCVSRTNCQSTSPAQTMAETVKEPGFLIRARSVRVIRSVSCHLISSARQPGRVCRASVSHGAAGTIRIAPSDYPAVACHATGISAPLGPEWWRALHRAQWMHSLYLRALPGFLATPAVRGTIQLSSSSKSLMRPLLTLFWRLSFSQGTSIREVNHEVALPENRVATDSVRDRGMQCLVCDHGRRQSRRRRSIKEPF